MRNQNNVMALRLEYTRKSLYDTVRHYLLGFLQGRNPCNDKFLTAETLVKNDELCHLRGFVSFPGGGADDTQT